MRCTCAERPVKRRASARAYMQSTLRVHAPAAAATRCCVGVGVIVDAVVLWCGCDWCSMRAMQCVAPCGVCGGTLRRIRFLEDMEVIILSNHRIVPPYGMAGGAPGECGRNWVERVDGSVEELTATDLRVMQPGDVFVIDTPGGGGFGAASSAASVAAAASAAAFATASSASCVRESFSDSTRIPISASRAAHISM